MLKEFALRDKFDGDVSIELEDMRIDFDDENVTLNAVKLEPQVGGLTALSMQLQCTPTTDEIATLVSSLNREVRVEVTFGGRRKPKGKKQAELPMGSHAQHPDPDATNGAADAPATH